jgi:hypothetical protein
LAEERKHKGVDATVVEVDPKAKPIESVVVGDKRRLLGQRLAALAMALLLLFFGISGYIQSARNGKDVHNLARANRNQTELIKKLQDALKQQNKILAKAGYRTIRIPGENTHTTTHLPQPQPQQSSNPSHTPPSPKPRPTHGSHSPHPRTSHSPNPGPSSKPGPVGMVRDRVCSLTGICLFIFFKFF